MEPRVERYALPTFSTPDGDLRVLDFSRLPFQPKRDFWITAVHPHVVRGGHAHRTCWQFFRGLAGCATITITGPRPSRLAFEYRLHLGSDAVCVPPWHWVAITMASESALLHCLASHPYQPSDYLNTWAEFDAGP